MLQVPLEQQEQQVLQEVLDRLVQKVRLDLRVQQARLAQREKLDPQVLRAIRESQVLRDLLVLQDQSERLDRLVLQAQLAQQDQ